MNREKRSHGNGVGEEVGRGERTHFHGHESRRHWLGGSAGRSWGVGHFALLLSLLSFPFSREIEEMKRMIREQSEKKEMLRRNQVCHFLETRDEIDGGNLEVRRGL